MRFRRGVNLAVDSFVIHDVGVAVRLDFETLFRCQFPRLVAVAVAMSTNFETAIDLAQETMARAHTHWEEVAEMDSPEAWTRRVMTNLLIDHHRRGRVEAAALELFASRPTTIWEPIGDDLADWLVVLPARQRAAVALYYIEDLSVAEVADALGVATGTVKALLWKARHTLANHLTMEVTP
jgi:RNA polymerase sigma-70 factor, ECF subfamily